MRYFTHYWKNDSWDSEVNNHVLNHAGSNVFSSRGLASGDIVYVVTVKGGKLLLGGRIDVDRIVSRAKAVKILGNSNVWDASDHIIGRPPLGPFIPDRQVPQSVVTNIRFVGGGKVKFTSSGIDQQTLRGVRELTADSAIILDKVLAVPALSKPAVQATPYPLFLIAKIGWMNRYNGFTPADPKVIGGSAYVRKNDGEGHEATNFRIVKDQLFGYIQRQPKSKQISLDRIDSGKPGDSLSGVLIIFIAPNPNTGKQTVVGWYRNATLYRVKQTVNVAKGKDRQYVASVNSNEAVLLPVMRRVPTSAPTIRYIYYPLEHDVPRTFKWLTELMDFVSGYNKENLLLEPVIVADAEAMDTAEVVEEQLAGYQSNPAIRKAVEDRAMQMAQSHFTDQGYDCHDTSKQESFDFLCTRGSEKLYVEVKGTQTGGGSVIVTKNEVSIAHTKQSVLFVVHSIVVTGSETKPKANGGIPLLYETWADDSWLMATHYRVNLVKAGAAINPAAIVAKA